MAAERQRIYTFKFRGRLMVEQERKREVEYYYKEKVSDLNLRSGEIAQEIEREIARALPPSVSVQVQIGFDSGSITWAGIISILDWMARLEGSTMFVIGLANLIQIVIQRVLGQQPGIQGSTSSTDVSVVGSAEGVTEELQVNSFRRSRLRPLALLTGLNTLLLLILLVSAIIFQRYTLVAEQQLMAVPKPLLLPRPMPTSIYVLPPALTPSPISCSNDASFEADLTAFPSTFFEPGSPFEKTWRLQNIGTCTWDTRYKLVFAGGTDFNSLHRSSLLHPVPPRATIDINVPMVAPSEPGSYAGRWQLSDPNGNTFGDIVNLVVDVAPSSGEGKSIQSPAPPSPANLTSTTVRLDGFDFTWIDSSTNEQGFRLYNADTGQILATFAANATAGRIGGLACGTSYRFYLVSFSQSGESWPSNMVQSTTSICRN